MKNNQVINQGTVSRLLMSLPDKVINQDINKDIMSRLFFKVIHSTSIILNNNILKTWACYCLYCLRLVDKCGYMVFYPYVNVIDKGIPHQRSPKYICGYEREDEIPADSCKPEWPSIKGNYTIKLFVGYQEVVVPFPSYSLFKSFTELADSSGLPVSESMVLYRHLLPCLEKYGIPSYDYYCRSNHPSGNIIPVDQNKIDNLLIEWIGCNRYHFLTLKQFCEIDFNHYFDVVPRGRGTHYDENMEYLSRIIFGNLTSVLDRKRNVLTERKKKNQWDKIEELLRTDITRFAVEHFVKYIKRTKPSMYD